MTKPTLLMTRPRPSAERFVARLRPSIKAAVNVVYAPLIDIAATGNVPDLSSYRSAIFSSVHGVALSPEGQGQPAFCVGATTAKAAQARGWDVKCIEQTADALVARMTTMTLTSPLVHLSGRHRRGDIAARLTDHGHPTEVVEVYDQHLRELTQEAKECLSGEFATVVPLFSPRTAAHFASQVACSEQIHCLALSAAVAKALGSEWQAQTICAAAPTGDELAQAVEMLISGASLA